LNVLIYLLAYLDIDPILDDYNAYEDAFYMLDDMTMEFLGLVDRLQQIPGYISERFMSLITGAGNYCKQNHLKNLEILSKYGELARRQMWDLVYEENIGFKLGFMDMSFCVFNAKSMPTGAIKKIMFIKNELIVLNDDLDAVNYIYKSYVCTNGMMGIAASMSSVLNKVVGMRVQGLNIDISTHIKENNEVGRFLEGKFGALMRKTLVKTFEITWLPTGLFDKYSHLLRDITPGMIVNEISLTGIDSSWDHLVEVLLISDWCRRNNNIKLKALMTSRPHIAISHNKHVDQWKPIPIGASNDFDVNYIYTTSTINHMLNILEGRRVILEKNNDPDDDLKEIVRRIEVLKHQMTKSYDGALVKRRKPNKDELKDYKMINLGFSLMEMSITQIKELLMNSNIIELEGLTVNLDVMSENRMFVVSDCERVGYRVVNFKHGTKPLFMNIDLYDIISQQYVLDVDGERFEVSHFRKDLGCLWVRFTRLLHDEMILYKQVSNEGISSKSVRISLPVLILDPARWIKEGKIFENLEVTMSERLYNKLTIRVLREGTSVDDLEYYARTLMHSTIYTEKTFYSAINDKVDNIKLAACACYYIVKIEQDSIIEGLEWLVGSESNFYHQKPNDDLINIVKEKLRSILLGSYGRIMTYVTDRTDIPNIAEDLIEKLFTHELLNKQLFGLVNGFLKSIRNLNIKKTKQDKIIVSNVTVEDKPSMLSSSAVVRGVKPLFNRIFNFGVDMALNLIKGRSGQNACTEFDTTYVVLIIFGTKGDIEPMRLFRKRCLSKFSNQEVFILDIACEDWDNDIGTIIVKDRPDYSEIGGINMDGIVNAIIGADKIRSILSQVCHRVYAKVSWLSKIDVILVGQAYDIVFNSLKVLLSKPSISLSPLPFAARHNMYHFNVAVAPHLKILAERWSWLVSVSSISATVNEVTEVYNISTTANDIFGDSDHLVETLVDGIFEPSEELYSNVNPLTSYRRGNTPDVIKHSKDYLIILSVSSACGKDVVSFIEEFISFAYEYKQNGLTFVLVAGTQFKAMEEFRIKGIKNNVLKKDLKNIIITDFLDWSELPSQTILITSAGIGSCMNAISNKILTVLCSFALDQRYWVDYFEGRGLCLKYPGSFEKIFEIESSIISEVSQNLARLEVNEYDNINFIIRKRVPTSTLTGGSGYYGGHDDLKWVKINKYGERIDERGRPTIHIIKSGSHKNLAVDFKSDPQSKYKVRFMEGTYDIDCMQTLHRDKDNKSHGDLIYVNVFTQKGAAYIDDYGIYECTSCHAPVMGHSTKFRARCGNCDALWEKGNLAKKLPPDSMVPATPITDIITPNNELTSYTISELKTMCNNRPENPKLIMIAAGEPSGLDVEPGRYLMLVTLSPKKIYDPTAVGDCLLQVFLKRFGDDHRNAVLQAFNMIGSAKFNRIMDAVAVACILHVNIQIYFEARLLTLVVDNKRPMISIQVLNDTRDEKLPIGHAVLIERQNLIGNRQVPNYFNVDSTLMESKCKIGCKVLNISSKYPTTHNQQVHSLNFMFIQQIQTLANRELKSESFDVFKSFGYEFDDLAGAMELKNFSHVVERKSQCASFNKFSENEFGIVIDGNNRSFRQNDIYLIHTNRGFVPSLCVLLPTTPGKTDKYYCFLTGCGKMGATGLLIHYKSCGMTFKQILQKEKLTALDQSAKKKYSFTYGTTLSVRNELSEKLVIYNYDNRSHHKYDLLEFIKKYSKNEWVWLGDTPDDEELEYLFSRPILTRVAYVDGKVKPVVYINNSYDVLRPYVNCFDPQLLMEAENGRIVLAKFGTWENTINVWNRFFGHGLCTYGNSEGFSTSRSIKFHTVTQLRNIFRERLISNNIIDVALSNFEPNMRIMVSPAADVSITVEAIRSIGNDGYYLFERAVYIRDVCWFLSVVDDMDAEMESEGYMTTDESDDQEEDSTSDDTTSEEGGLSADHDPNKDMNDGEDHDHQKSEHNDQTDNNDNSKDDMTGWSTPDEGEDNEFPYPSGYDTSKSQGWSSSWDDSELHLDGSVSKPKKTVASIAEPTKPNDDEIIMDDDEIIGGTVDWSLESNKTSNIFEFFKTIKDIEVKIKQELENLLETQQIQVMNLPVSGNTRADRLGEKGGRIINECGLVAINKAFKLDMNDIREATMRVRDMNKSIEENMSLEEMILTLQDLSCDIERTLFIYRNADGTYQIIFNASNNMVLSKYSVDHVFINFNDAHWESYEWVDTDDSFRNLTGLKIGEFVESIINITISRCHIIDDYDGGWGKFENKVTYSCLLGYSDLHVRCHNIYLDPSFTIRLSDLESDAKRISESYDFKDLKDELKLKIRTSYLAKNVQFCVFNSIYYYGFLRNEKMKGYQERLIVETIPYGGKIRGRKILYGRIDVRKLQVEEEFFKSKQHELLLTGIGTSIKDYEQVIESLAVTDTSDENWRTTLSIGDVEIELSDILSLVNINEAIKPGAKQIEVKDSVLNLYAINDSILSEENSVTIVSSLWAEYGFIEIRLKKNIDLDSTGLTLMEGMTMHWIYKRGCVVFAAKAGSSLYPDVISSGRVGDDGADRVEWKYYNQSKPEYKYNRWWDIPQHQDRHFDSVAFGIPSGEGKSKLAEEYPEVFIDHDSLLDQREHIRLNLEAKKTGDWSKVHAFHKNINIPKKNKVLLTWGKYECPDHIKYKHGCLLNEGTGIRENESNRESLKKESGVKYFKNFKERNDYLFNWVVSQGNKKTNKYIRLREFDIDTMTCEALTELKFNELPEYPTEAEARYSRPNVLIEHVPSDGGLFWKEDNEIEEIAPVQVVDMWDNLDYRDYHDKWAPARILGNVESKLPQPDALKMESRTVVGQIKKLTKWTLTKYPIYSRPVLQQMRNAEFNAVTSRLGSVVVLRKHRLNTENELRKLRRAYFHSNAENLSEIYRANSLTFNGKEIINWLSDRKDAVRIAADLRRVLADGLSQTPLNAVNVHAKNEALLKDDNARITLQNVDIFGGSWSGQDKELSRMTTQSITKVMLSARIIVWQPKALCCIYAPIFIEAKKRLKKLLRPEFVYADGLTPDELSSRIRSVKNCRYIFENDLSKQDRQTDDDILNVEFALYAYLGVHADVLKSWRTIHHMWRFKGGEGRGWRHGMRLTGQATTALGNVITDMIVHSDFVIENYDNIELLIMLGDDNVMFMKKKPDLLGYKSRMINYYNMQCKPEIGTNQGYFCCMLIYKNSMDMYELGPDLIRYKRRLEVTKGASDPTDENVTARMMSYTMMIGSCDRTQKIIKDKGWPLEPKKWYDVTANRVALSERYNMSIEEVDGQIESLFRYIENPKIYTKEFLVNDNEVPIRKTK